MFGVLLIAIGGALDWWYQQAVKKGKEIEDKLKNKSVHDIPAGFYHDQALKAFSDADTNKDGVLEARELLTVLNSLGFFEGVASEKIDAAIDAEFKKSDSINADKKITLKEFLPYFDALKAELEKRGASKQIEILGGDTQYSLNNLTKKAIESGDVKSFATIKYLYAKSNIVINSFLVASNDPFSRYERIWGLIMVHILVIQINIMIASAWEFTSTTNRICDPQACRMVKEKFCSDSNGESEITQCFNALTTTDHMDIEHLRAGIVSYETCTTQRLRPLEDLEPYLAVIQSFVVLAVRIPFTVLWEKVSRMQTMIDVEKFSTACVRLTEMELGRLITYPLSMGIFAWCIGLLSSCWPTDQSMYSPESGFQEVCALEQSVATPPPSYFEQQPHCICFPESFECDYQFAKDNACVGTICFRTKYGTVIVSVALALSYSFFTDFATAFAKCKSGYFTLKNLKEDIEKHNRYLQSAATGAIDPAIDPEAVYVVHESSMKKRKDGRFKIAASALVAASALSVDAVKISETGKDEEGVKHEAQVVADWAETGEGGALDFARSTVKGMGSFKKQED